MKRALGIWIIAALAALPGCSLLVDADDHVGGSRDGGSDAGADAGLEDGGVDDGGASDAGTDAGPPPSECELDAECGAVGAARCIDGRCVFCAGSAPIVDVGSSSAYDGRISMAIGPDGANSEIGIVWTGAGSASYAYRTPVVAPVAPPAAPSSRTDALLMQLNVTASVDIVALEIGPKYYGAGDRWFEISAVVHDPTRSSHNYALWEPTRFTHATFPNPQNYTDPERILGPIVLLGGGNPFAVARRRTASGEVELVAFETSYGNERQTYVRADLTDDAVVEPAAAGRLAGFPTSTGLLLWDGVVDRTPAVVPTSDRDGRAAMAVAGAERYWVAYPAGAQIRVRLFECGSDAISSCMYDDTIAYDVETDAASIEHVSIVDAGGRPVVLAYERMADGSGRLAMRMLRASGLPYDAPGGGTALVLESLAAGTQILDARLVSAPDGASGRYVAAWMRAPEGAGARTLRLTSRPIACDP